MGTSKQMLTFFASFRKIFWLVMMMKRVELVADWFTGFFRTSRPYTFPAYSPATAAWLWSPSCATFLAAKALLGRLICFQSCSDRNRADCIRDWGWEYTVRISSIFVPGSPSRQCSIRMICSPTMKFSNSTSRS